MSKLKERVKRTVVRFRSAVTGRFVSREDAARSPRESVRERPNKRP